LRVARQALAVGTNALRLYAPRVYTQPQLFACLVFKTDYRGIAEKLRDLADLRRAVALRRVPHYTTLQKAAARLLRQPRARRLFHTTVRRHFGRRRRSPRVAFDSSGLDGGHASRYFIRHRVRKGSPWQDVAYSRYAELELAVDCASHVIVGVLTSRGPRVDTDRFVQLLEATWAAVRPRRVVADAGYDSEPNHRHTRERRGVRSFIPAAAGRPTSKPPTGRYRRQMRRRLNKDYGGYGQRWQCETVFSMIKRRLATAVQGRGYWSQCREF
jgi:hypothetical protein